MKTVRPITTPYRHSPFCRSELRLYFESACFIRKSAGNTVSRQADLSGSCPFSGWKISPRGVISALSYPEHSTMTEKKTSIRSDTGDHFLFADRYHPQRTRHCTANTCTTRIRTGLSGNTGSISTLYHRPQRYRRLFPSLSHIPSASCRYAKTGGQTFFCRMSNMAYSPHVRPCVPTPSV